MGNLNEKVTTQIYVSLPPNKFSSPLNILTPPPTVGSDVTIRQNWSVAIRCRTMAVGAALVL